MNKKNFRTARQKILRQGFQIILLAVVITLFLISMLLHFYHHMNNHVYSDLIIKNLESSHKEQIKSTTSTITESKRLMEAVAFSLKDKDRQQLHEDYFDIFEKLDNLYDVAYYSADELKRFTHLSAIPFADVQLIERILLGETVVSDVRISARLNGVCDFTIAVPIVESDGVTGAIFGQVKAELLTHISESQEDNATDNYLLLPDGDILLQGKTYLNGRYNLLEEMKAGNESEKLIEQTLTALTSGGTSLVTLPDTPRGTVYLMISPLGYNGWQLLSISYLEEVESYSSMITRNTVSLVITLLLLLVPIILLTILGFSLMKQRVLEKQANYRLLAHFSDTILFLYDCKTRLLNYTPNITDNYAIDRIEGIDIFGDADRLQAIHPDDVQLLREKLEEFSMAEAEGDDEVSIRFLNKAGEYGWMSYQLNRIRDKKGNVTAIVGKLQDIHEYKLREHYLLEQSSRDFLTGAYNRGSTEEKITALLSCGAPGFFLLADVDNFKYVNDTFGHAAGDYVLLRLVEEAKHTFDDKDIVGRIGGDEFVIYVPDAERSALIERKMDIFLRRLQDLDQFQVTVSVGIAAFPQNGTTFDELCHAADTAMYHIKKNGKNGYAFAEPMQTDPCS